MALLGNLLGTVDGLVGSATGALSGSASAGGGASAAASGTDMSHTLDLGALIEANPSVGSRTVCKRSKPIRRGESVADAWCFRPGPPGNFAQSKPIRTSRRARSVRSKPIRRCRGS